MKSITHFNVMENKMKKDIWKDLPFNSILINGIGLVLLGVGLIDWLASTHLVPTVLQFENYPIFMVVIGIFLLFSSNPLPDNLKPD